MTDIVIKAEHITKIFHRTHKRSSFSDIASHAIQGKYKLTYEDEVVAIDDISFELQKGGALGIIGNNGAGKSTLLKIICGITKPTSGKIVIDGNVSAFLDMGIALVSELTGTENIFIYGNLQGIPTAKIKKLFSSIVDFSELGDFIDTPVKYYSTGMMMRLAFSVVVHSDKDILIFDEVFAVGDIFFRKKCHKWLSNLRNEKKTIILVSHQMNEIANFCDHLMLLDKGKVIANGNVPLVVKKYNDTLYKREKKLDGKTLKHSQLSFSAKNIINDEVHWVPDEAPGNEQCKLLGVQIIYKDPFQANEKKDLFLKMHTRFNDFSGDLGFIISDILDNRLFTNLTRHHLHLDLEEKINNGEFELEWKIPHEQLNNGIYKVSIIILDKSGNIQYRVMDILAFELKHETDTEGIFITPLRFNVEFTLSKIN